MEGETQERGAPKPETEAPPFLRVEFDGEHKIFVKECAACGNVFRTSVPKKFFENPNDDSTKLRANGSDAVDGHKGIRASVVQQHIFETVCTDDSRHSPEAKAV